MNKEESNAKQREYRRKNGNKVTVRYEKTKNGFLMRLYRNMQSRTSGIQKQKFHLYRGCELLPRDEFYEWSKSSEAFHELFRVWESSGYERKLTPSVDRKDSDFGYSINNMEWVTHSENSRRGASSRKRINAFSDDECIAINNLRNGGSTYKVIADIYGSTASRIHQLINRTEYFKKVINKP
jgi:hypothetical protein